MVDRPLGMMAADVGDAPPEELVDVGIRCPGCGCKDLRVYYTRSLTGGRIRRRRICRNCGRMVSTTEKLQ